jgi:hypothetical protein
MTQKTKSLEAVEAFVARVLKSSFNQKVDAETLRSVAEKVARAVEVDQDIDHHKAA